MRKLCKFSELPAGRCCAGVIRRYKLTGACVCKIGGDAGDESESRARTIPLDRGDFSRVHWARSRYPADDCAAEAGNDELGEESGSTVGRPFCEPCNLNARAHSAGHAFYGART